MHRCGLCISIYLKVERIRSSSGGGPDAIEKSVFRRKHVVPSVASAIGKCLIAGNSTRGDDRVGFTKKQGKVEGDLAPDPGELKAEYQSRIFTFPPDVPVLPSDAAYEPPFRRLFTSRRRRHFSTLSSAFECGTPRPRIRAVENFKNARS